MSKEVKTKIYQLLDDIENEVVLNQLMEEVTFYASRKDITDELIAAQLPELDKAIDEAEKKESIPSDDFKMK